MNTWLNLDDSKPLRYQKRAIYAGRFNKDGTQFEVTPALLNRLAESVTELRDAGVDIPFTNSHDWMDAKNRLGDVVGASVENDALYLGIDFADEVSRDLALKADVSIGYVQEFLDGKGVNHKHVLRHLAATSAPVIPSLGEWQELIASFGGKIYDMSKIFETLNVADEDAALEAIKQLQEAARPAEKIELSYPTTVIKALQDARMAQLDALVATGEISPAVKGELALAFCNEKNLGLELSHQSTDQYEQTLKLVKLASKSQPVSPSGRTSKPIGGGVELSHEGSETYLDRFKKWAEANK